VREEPPRLGKRLAQFVIEAARDTDGGDSAEGSDNTIKGAGFTLLDEV